MPTDLRKSRTFVRRPWDFAVSLADAQHGVNRPDRWVGRFPQVPGFPGEHVAVEPLMLDVALRLRCCVLGVGHRELLGGVRCAAEDSARALYRTASARLTRMRRRAR